MKVSEAFLVNTKNFAPIIETLANYDADDITINSTLLENLSYSDPNDLLVVRILKDFSIIDNDGKPAKYFQEFQHPETTKRALAKGLIHAYEGIFNRHENIHQQPTEKIKEVFEEYFKDKKTDLIIKYITGTFEKVVSHIGPKTIDAVLKGYPEQEVTVAAIEHSNERSNGASSTQGNRGSDDEAVFREDISENNIDDILSEFEGLGSISSSSDKPGDSHQEPSSKEDSTDSDLSSIQEFVRDIEEATDEPEKTDENSANRFERQTEELDDDRFNFEIDEQPKYPSPPSQKATSNKDNKDIDPHDLELPLSQAIKKGNAMQNLTNEHQFVQKALIRKSDLLHKMKRWEELLPTLEEIINRYEDRENIDFKDAVERAIIRRAIVLLKLGNSEKILPALNSVINRFKDSTNKEFYEQASRAMLFKVKILERDSTSPEDLLPLYNDIINRLDSNSELLLKEKLDEIHCKRFDLIITGDNKTMQLEASTKFINRFKGTNKHQDYLQKAMIIRAELLDDMGKDEAALQAYDEFLQQFGN